MLNKDAEIKSEIQAAIGLDFEQFCRTTMLAQGEFTRFLNSKDIDKSEILEKITGADIYSKIGQKVFYVQKHKREEWDAAKLLAEAIKPDDAKIAANQDALATLDNQYKEIKAECDKDVEKRDWLKKDIELTQGKNEAAAALHIANEAIESEDFKLKESTVKEWNSTIDARLWIKEAKKASSTLNEQKETIGKLAETYSVLLGGLKYAENEVGKLDSEIKDIETFISSEADKVIVYENAQTIVGHLTTIVEGNKSIKKCHTAIETENKKLTLKLALIFEKAKDEAKDARVAVEKEAADIKSLEEAVSILNLSELRGKRDSAKDLLVKISTAKDRLDTLASAKSQYEEKRESLAIRKITLDEKIELSSSMDIPIHDAKIKMSVRKEDYDKQRDTVDNFASAIRSKLHKGDICPVCRQEIMSALPQEEELIALVNGIEKAYKDAEKEYNELADKKVKLDAEIKIESKAYEHDYTSFCEDKSVANAEQKVMEACNACGIEEQDDTLFSVLTSFEDSTSDTVRELGAKIKDGEAQETEVKKLRKALETKLKGVETLEAKVLEVEKAMDECRGRIATSQALMKSKNEDVNNAIKKASELIVGSWQIDWQSSPEEFASSLTISSREYNCMVQNKHTLTSLIQTSKTNVENVQDVLTAILTSFPTWTDIQASDVVLVDNLLIHANNLRTSVETALVKLRTAEESLNTNLTKLNSFLAEHPELNYQRLEALNAYTSADITREDNSLKAIREAIVAKTTLFHNAQKLIAGHQVKKPDYAEYDTLDALTERIENIEKQITEIGEKKGAIIQELKTYEANKKQYDALCEDVQKKGADYQKWSRLNELIGDADGKKFRTIAQSYVLTSLIHSANSYMKTLTDRYTLKIVPGTFTISVEDAYQGYACRAASTISGGESFLVSLSLALALSDIGNTLSVDTLFIDEGFGTLSGDALQNAINTLRSLHAKAGRHVGIISHVEELQERIPVQIQVNQESSTSSSKVVIVP